MRRILLNYLVDVVSAIVVFAMIATGLVIRFVLPPGSGGRGGGRGLSLWGMGRHDWGDVHFWLAIATATLLAIHVALHWAWVCSTTRQILRGKRSDAVTVSAWNRNLYGLGFLAVVMVLFAGFLYVASRRVQTVGTPTGRPWSGHRGNADRSPEAPGKGGSVKPATQHQRGYERKSNGHHEGGEQIRGSMTLADVEAITHVSVTELRTQLGLPPSVSANEQLGRLRNQYGFEMSTVREIVNRYRGTMPAEP